MRRARRAAHVFFRLSDDVLPNIGRLLEGELELIPQTRLLAFSALSEKERAVSRAEYEFLKQLPSDRWTAVDELAMEPERVEQLALAGLVVSDAPDGPFAELRRRDDRLKSSWWEPYAALCHSRARWRDVDAGRFLESASERPSGDGTPPPAFHASADAGNVSELPIVEPEDDLFRLLLARRTTRGLDATAPLTREELAVLLYYTFGCHGYARLDDEVVLLKRTSPSGGSLHPIEAYPLVLGVEGFEPGIYHYRSDLHALELLQPLERATALERLREFTAGQWYLASTQVVVVLTARFARSFWKYRGQSRAYGVVLMDAAHVSQTFYLVCAQLGLGAFVSAAVNAANIEDELGLDGFEEGVLAICGCGRPAAERSPFDLEFEPYVPRRTVIER
jgi:putative peptide maturation dehydrogenase